MGASKLPPRLSQREVTALLAVLRLGAEITCRVEEVRWDTGEPGIPVRWTLLAGGIPMMSLRIFSSMDSDPSTLGVAPTFERYQHPRCWEITRYPMAYLRVRLKRAFRREAGSVQDHGAPASDARWLDAVLPNSIEQIWMRAR